MSEDLIEIESAKKCVKWNLPIQIAFFVYNYAKLRMLEFYYDCIDNFIDRNDIELFYMDTDSLYFSLTTSSLEASVKPELRQQFYRDYNKWFPARVCDDHHDEFVRQIGILPNNKRLQYCLARQSYDKRTPGLFKMEYENGTGFIGLCSKTYFCFGKKDKLSCKGLNKNLNHMNREKYLDVLKSQKDGEGKNRGFRSNGRAVFTYE